MNFRDQPIRRKLMAIIGLAAGLGLTLNLILFTLGDLQSKRNAMESQLASIAQIIAETSASAIRFDDSDAAMATLSGLSARHEIISAHITLPGGRVLAHYSSLTKTTAGTTPATASQNKDLDKSKLHLQQPVRQDGELIGMVTIEADLEDAWQETLSSLSIASLTSLLAFVVAMFMATRLQKSISRPLLQLSAMVDAVAADGDHNRRLNLSQRDEIGELANRFNAMLEELQWREVEAQQHRDQLEDEVEQRTTQLRLAKDQAESASLAKTRFLANMSHELRTPLNAVIGAAQLLKDGTRDVETQEQMIEAIQKSGTNLLGLIEDILDLSRIEVGELHIAQEDFHLLDCAESALATAGLAARAKGLILTCIIAPEIAAWRHGDPNRIRQILMNLLGNAIKFTPSGEVVVRIDGGEQMEDLRISVNDTGVGIGAASLPHIFEPFRQADDGANRRFGGSGLGLSIVHQLVETMGGRISVQSQLGQGTYFEINLYLPYANMPTAVAAPLGLPIAYYEPHEHSAEALASQLSRLGCVSTRVHNRDELEHWLHGVPHRINAPWLLLACDDALSASFLGGIEAELDPERVIGMTRAASNIDNLTFHSLKLAHNIYKPVSRAALVSRLGMQRRTEVEEPVTMPAPLITGTSPVAKFHVLVVEDDALNQTIVCRLLSHGGFMSTAANDGAQALALMGIQHFDLVLMDWQMPDMDGLEVTRRMRSGEAGTWGKTVPIVALTANAFAEDRAACMAAGMNDFLTKPVLSNRLIAAVQRWTKDVDHALMYPESSSTAQTTHTLVMYDPAVLAALPMVADGSEPEYAQELMTMFFNSSERILSKVETAIKSKDWRLLQLTLHTLKSTSASVGALELAALAEWHEQAIRQGHEPALNLAKLIADAFKRLERATHVETDAIQ